MKKIILWAAFIYFLLAPLTYHPDNKAVLSWAGSDGGTVWNIWNYQEKNLSQFGYYNYPPIHFYLDKLQYWLARPLAGAGFDTWLNLANITDKDQLSLPRYSLAIKTGLIGCSLLTGYLIYLIAKTYQLSDKKARLAAGLWLFNPVTIYSVAMMGQNDVLMITLFLYGWYLYQRLNDRVPTARWQWLWPSLLFGLSIATKTTSLFWLPCLLLIDQRQTVKTKLKIFGGSLLTYGLTLLPFLSNPIFRRVVLNNSGFTDRLLLAEISLNHGEKAVYLVPLLLVVTIAAFCRCQQLKTKNQLAAQAFGLMTVNLILISWINFHPQWWTWVIVFWSLWLPTLAPTKQRLIYGLTFLGIGAWLATILFFPNDGSLSLAMLQPLNPQLANLPPLRTFLTNHQFDVARIDNLARSWLAILSLLALIQLYQPKENDD